MKNTCVRHDIGSDFHAGHFLRDLLHEQGHDAVWLAEHTGCTMPFVTTLLEQPIRFAPDRRQGNQNSKNCN